MQKSVTISDYNYILSKQLLEMKCDRYMVDLDKLRSININIQMMERLKNICGWMRVKKEKLIVVVNTVGNLIACLNE